MARILVAEDEPGIAMALEDDLTLEGYDVEVAGDGELASRRAREGDFDLLLLDIMLPRKSGFDVCRELRRAGLRMPILMLTAKTQESDKVMGLDLGADDYVTKPYSPHELRHGCARCLRRTLHIFRRTGSDVLETTKSIWLAAKCDGRDVSSTLPHSSSGC
jgi:DNA-binding response OmpR family regulator